MNDSDICIKTAAGSDELKTRSRGLALRLRSVLILVDGSRSVAALRAAAAALGAPPDGLELLLREGLIEPAGGARNPVAERAETDVSTPVRPALEQSDAERFVVAQKFMIETTAEALGLKAFFFTLKLEKCYTLADLNALMPEFSQALVKARGELKARALTQHLKLLLG
jgi:predicted secreted protein